MSRRTTLTLEDDIAAKLEEEQRRSGASFKELVNTFLRRGLAMPRGPRPGPSFRVEARDLGRRPGIEIDDVEGLLDRVEGSSRR